MLVIVMVAGGGGEAGRITHTVTTSYDGSLDGVDTSPGEDATDLSFDVLINVHWDLESLPPSEFTVRLEEERTPGNWAGVPMKPRDELSSPENRYWWFEPDSLLSPSTRYRIVIQADGETAVVHEFKTIDVYEVEVLTKGLGTTKTKQ